MAEHDGDVNEEDLKELQAFLSGATNGVSAHDDPLPEPPGFDAQPPNGLRGEASAKVVVKSDDPHACYLAAQTWEDLQLPQAILDGIYEMGFVKPSKIQEWTLPIALKGGNIIGQAQNGSGKTAAFSLAILLAVERAKAFPQGLCVCPTRELAMQNLEVTRALGKFCGLDFFLAVPLGDKPPRRVEAQVIIGTPGKMQDLLKKRVIDPKEVRIFILDEADVMVDEDNMMAPQVLQIRNLLPSEPMQVILFSATWPERVQQFAARMVPRPNWITVQKEDLTLSTITQTFIDVDAAGTSGKQQRLSDLYGALTIGQSIIFVNSRNKAFELAKAMQLEGYAVSLICGTQKTGPEQIDISYRDRIMDEFRRGVTKVLIATDVLARGIDVPAVTLVVNFDLPVDFRDRRKPDFETYMHRIGRTGRFGLKGVAVNLITAAERPMLDSIRTYYQCSIEPIEGDCEEMASLLRELR